MSDEVLEPSVGQKRRGRRPIYGSDAERQAAFRERHGGSQAALAILQNLNVKVVKLMIDQVLAKTPDRAGAIEELNQHLAAHAAGRAPTS